ncbi:NAD(P)H-dependent oxidoreductase [Halomonas sp. McH1-25]|uniref:NAD(P)H-dependent oxidoreductase n=1 Tax=unclassified Halomonas TaxID=2609666 RepID=UPI001EF4FEAF|nr:NAD(P)H-dependent oxidoreductase [Halomonas sp. McH1-25]MCP1344104.1 NAD(P)H-dependent oxidoreductase [Halomonas sp. FL8]MCP1362639.1 NAD(P)H-dependent oxidoreductase [Halomonas sp. BBD45]
MKIFLINGGKAFAHSGGRYNDTLHDIARGTLAEMGHELQETKVDDGYDIDEEVRKFLWADAIVYQMPGWWMGAPWTVKKYLDEVFTAGHGSLYASDGRSRHDASRHYGSGGLLQGRHYMLSLTWNAPAEAFDEPGNFFAGRGVDAVYFPFHKSQEFVGLEALPTFLANDVIKAPDIEGHIAAYREHLKRTF